MGGIGRDLKKKAEALGMKIQYHNRSPLSTELSGGAKYVGFEELLKTSDVISVNVPLNVSAILTLNCFLVSAPKLYKSARTDYTDELTPSQPQKSTHHMLSTPQFDLMKPGVVIVNTARGAVIDEAALVQALSSSSDGGGKVFSVGLDVYEDEPEIHPGLLDNPHVLLLPHLGTWTVETQIKMELWNVENVRCALETGRLKSPVVEQRDMQ